MRAEIDAISPSRLVPLIVPAAPPGAPVPTLPAFDVWSQTSLATTRLTAAVELYSADGSLVSRFALNMPEYRGAADATPRPGQDVDWENWHDRHFMAREGLEPFRSLSYAPDMGRAVRVALLPVFHGVLWFSRVHSHAGGAPNPTLPTPARSRCRCRNLFSRCTFDFDECTSLYK